MSESRFFHLTRNGKLVTLGSLPEALAAAKQGGYIWLDYCKPAKEELSALIEPLGLHPLSIADCIDENQVPKMNDFPTNAFMIFNALGCADGKFWTDEVDLFIGTNFLVSVSGHDPRNRRTLDGIERIVSMDPDSVRHGPDFLLHIILDHVVDHKFESIEAIEEALDAAEETMLADVSRFQPADLMRLRRDLLGVRKSLFHEREILVKICRKDCHFISDKAIFHYRDIYDHLTKLFEMTETSREIVTSLMEMYLSMVNNRMAQVANQTNMSVRRLTFITTIFMPLTLLAGIGGMSEWSMMTGPHNWRIAYPAFLGSMVVIGVVTYLILKRLGVSTAGAGDQTTGK
jgi:magnesium transporter